MANKFKAIQEKHGAESVAFLSTGQMVTEEMAFLGALAKFGMGMRHGDGNTRQCMATAVVAYKQSFGFDAPPYTYQDFEESEVLVFVGANPCIAHPIMWERVCRNPNNPKIVVVDPRKTETAMAATHHYPIKPKSDLAFFYGVANRLVQIGAVDQSFLAQSTEGFDAFKTHIAPYTLEKAEEASGIPGSEIDRLANLIADHSRVSFWWTMGINQSHEGVRAAQAIINIALMTGNIGAPVPAPTPSPVNVTPWARGCFRTPRIAGGTDFTNPDHRKEVAEILDIPEDVIPTQNSLAYDQILEKVLDGKIRGLWIVATNPGHSWINQDFFRQIASRLDFLVVQDMYHTTETAQQAHLVLPAAAWGEKEGTFINSERRFGVIRKVSQSTGPGPF